MTREKSFETAQLDQSYQMSNVSKNDFVENANKQEDGKKCKIFRIKRASRLSCKN